MNRFVADIGNTRIKLGRLDAEWCACADVAAISIEAESDWLQQVRAWTDRGLDTEWWISTVNPPATARLASVLGAPVRMRLMGSAREISVPNRLERPDSTGADRALAVLAALRRMGGGPGQVVSCGTAITVERVNEVGEWEGGAIAPGMRLAALRCSSGLRSCRWWRLRAEPCLRRGGGTTVSAIEAGVFWGVVGAVRELLTRQAAGFKSPGWRIWTGGDAEQGCAGGGWSIGQSGARAGAGRPGDRGAERRR